MLFRGWPEQSDGVEWRDVDSSPAWRAAYGLRVPVLMRGDELICELQPDAERLKHCFGEPIVPL